MKITIFTFVVMLGLAVPALSGATDLKQGAYVSGFIGGSSLKDADLETSGYDWQSEQYYESKDKVKFDTGISVGGTGGYDFGIIRLEGELSYKYNEVDSINGRDQEHYYLTEEVGTFAFMANVFFDLHNDSPITPYIGGGIGVATIYNGNDRNDYYDDDDYDDEEYDSVFAYQVGGGLEIALNKRLSLDVGYRYFVTDTAKFNIDSYYISQTSKIKLESHNVAVGLRFKF